MTWVSVKERLPEPLLPVLVCAQVSDTYRQAVIAKWVPGETKLDDNDFEGDSVYDEKRDCFWWPEGWYCESVYEEVGWAVSDLVTHWAPLPLLPGLEA